MKIHYNAFISYRHHPDDIRVAEEIHRSLERFRVPRALRKKTKGITRIFRDKEELPITSSLTEDIYRALDNSDFLIVICSVHTKESIWVQREIETFLRNHDHSKVLTVLASGEPYDVIPEILLHQEEIDPDTGEKRLVDIEPLSCDWRMNRKKALREELPRLAAALLNCGYDELRQRQRQYQMRRLIAGFSITLAAVLCLTAYFFYTSLRIQENLEQALRNQSQYLASSAQERQDAGDQLTAISLALAALPDESSQRPYIPVAEKALSDAMGSYISTETVQAVGAFTADAMVSDFRVTADSKLIYILDATNIISVWDTTTFQKLASIDTGATYIKDMFTTPGGRILFQTNENALFCYDSDGRLCWQWDKCNDVAFLQNGSLLMSMNCEELNQAYISFLNSETGKLQRDTLTLTTESSVAISGFYQDVYDEAQSITICCSTIDDNCIYLLDLNRPSFEELLRTPVDVSTLEGEYSCVTVTENGNIIVMVHDGSGFFNGYYQNIQITSPASSQIFCYSGQDHSLLWQSEITSSIYSGGYTMEPIPGTGQILCQSGNTFQVYEETSGTLLGECDASGVPILVIVDENSTTGILKDGSTYTYNYADNTCYISSFMEGNVIKADMNYGGYILQDLSYQVTKYRSSRDDSGETVAGDYSLSIYAHTMHENLLAIQTYQGLYLFDLAAQALSWSAELENTHNLLGFSGDGSTLWMWSAMEDQLAAFRTADASLRMVDIPLQIDDLISLQDSNLYWAEDRLIYALTAEGAFQLMRVDPENGSQEAWTIPELATAYEQNYIKDTVILESDADHIWFWQTSGHIYEFGTETGTLRCLAEEVGSEPIAWQDVDGSLALAANNLLLLFSPDGKADLQISLGERTAVSVCFYEEELLVLCDDGELYRYDRAGTLLSHINLAIYDTFFNKLDYIGDDPMSISWHFTPDGDLILNAFTAGNIIDCDQWQCRAFVPYFTAYSQDVNKLFSLSGGQLIAYPCYSTEQQMKKAKEMLNGFQLTEEQKTYYGID